MGAAHGMDPHLLQEGGLVPGNHLVIVFVGDFVSCSSCLTRLSISFFAGSTGFCIFTLFF